MERLASAVALVLSLLLAATSSNGEEGPVVRVSGGDIMGRVVSQPEAELATYYAFEGVPYARPPVGERRFKDPEEEEPWSGIRNATAAGAKCIQKDLLTSTTSGEEDCLFINVYTADPPESWADVRRPVVVWVHGGGFVMGSGDLDKLRPDSILRQEVIVASFNYRLGVMGFLSTGDAEAPGNAGLKDAVQALRWLQRNAEAFGGDPRRVTVFGESAGGAAVHYLLLSPLTRGLLHGAAAMSGAALSPWARTWQPRRHALALRRHLAAACPDVAPDAVAACLRRVDAKELVHSHDAAPPEELKNRIWMNPFLPSVEPPELGEGRFLTAEPEQLMREGNFLKVPFITGFTSAEGILYLKFAKLLDDPSRWRSMDENFVDMFRWEVPPALRSAGALNELRDFYMADRAIRDSNEDPEALRRFVQMVSDILFGASAVESARLMAASGAPVHVYEFTHEGPAPMLKRFLYNASHVAGVAHGDDLGYLFHVAQRRGAAPLAVAPAEAAVRERLVRLLAAFAATGNPTPEGSESPTWPVYTADKESYMDMNTEFTIKEHVLGDRIALWRRLASSSEPNAREETDV